MNNIPVFTAAGGCATLLLKEIPYKKTAYALIRSYEEGRLQQQISECDQFCRLAGAERVFVSAPIALDFLPKSHDLLRLHCPLSRLQKSFRPVPLQSVTGNNRETFLALYNKLFYPVPNAATLTAQELAEPAYLGFLAVSNGVFAGLGLLRENELAAIGVLPQYHGLGYPLALTLLDKLPGEEATLLVGSTNTRACRLYDRLGFTLQEVVSSWYEIP